MGVLVRDRMRIALALALAAPLALAAFPTTGAQADQTVTLKTSFVPNRLGARTTIEFEFEVHNTMSGRAPSPITVVDLDMPPGLGLASSSLGLANCEPARLLAEGLEGCPPNARVGFGSATAVVPGLGVPVEEEGTLTALIGPPNPEHLEVLFYAEADRPVYAQLVFPGQLLDGGPSFGERLNTDVPLIPTWPDGPDVEITRMASTIGPLGLTYYRDTRGKLVPFRPRGIALPKRCPRGGFRFRVDLRFLDGTQASATNAVRCP